MSTRKVLLLTVLLFGGGIFAPVKQGLALDQARCRQRFPFMYKTEGLLILSSRPTDSSTWSSQVSSSWGECSLIAAREQRAQFLYANLNNLMIDSARGGGEYLDALAFLSGCADRNLRNEFSAAVQNNFESIYLNNTASPEKIGNIIDETIMSRPLLKKACKITS